MDQIPGDAASFEDQIKKSLSNAYDIERELGGGGMSRVFVATDRLLGRKIVIKFLSPELIAEVNRGRFRREIQVAAQLQHPHIVTLLSAGEDNDLVYYTMPFIDGESLKSAVEKNGPLSVADVIRVLYDVVDALAYAHAHGVVHRDIKPANILRSGSHALVTDFGVAKALNAARSSSSALTSTGMAIGTPAYMAPEQLAGDTDADHRVDIYALGLLAYELLCGESPFAATSAQGVLAAVLTRDPKPLYLVRKDVPRKLSTIIMQCLSKVPGGRPPTAEALLDSLDMIATASGEIRTKEHKVPSRERTAPVARPTPAKSSTGPVSTSLLIDHEPEKSRKRYLIPAIAAVVIAGVASVLWFNRTPGSSAVSIQPPAAAGAESASATASVTPGSGANAAAPTAPVVPPVDTAAIAASVQNRIAQMVAAAAAKPGGAVVNADSLKKKLRRELTDSIAKANAARVAALPPAAAAQPSGPAAQPAAAPAPAPVAAAPAPAPVSNGKRRVAITEPKGLQDQPVLASFTHQFIDALHASLDNGESFAAVDQDSVRSVIAHTASRDEAARVLKPDVLISPSYVGSGETVNVLVTVWDLRSNSSYGIRVTSTKLEPSKPELYLGSLVQSVMKQLDDLNRTPTIYTKH
jgi:serine/threonine protein kinase